MTITLPRMIVLCAVALLVPFVIADLFMTQRCPTGDHAIDC